MKLHVCLVCIGSNTDKERNIQIAREKLKEDFPEIIWGSEILTEPLFFVRQDMFVNQLGVFKTSAAKEKIIEILKGIEINAGKLIDDKKDEIVRLDIDLLKYDFEVLKPKDMQRIYIKNGIEELQCLTHLKI